MEYDILNEIITGTVGSLFSGNFFSLNFEPLKSPLFAVTQKDGSKFKKNLQEEEDDRRAGSASGLNKKDAISKNQPNSVIQPTFNKNLPGKLLSQIDTSPTPSLNISGSSANSTNLNLIKTEPNSKNTVGIGNIAKPQTEVTGSTTSLTVSNNSNKSTQNTVGNIFEKKQSNAQGNQGTSSQTISNSLKGNVRQSEEELLDNWIKMEGPAKLKEALNRLKIDLKKLNKKDLEKMTYDQLLTEKKKVKNELKYYDSSFQGTFNRFPVRTEKEPMRDLYVYYKKLKQYLTEAEKREKERKKSGEIPASSSGNTLKKQPINAEDPTIKPSLYEKGYNNVILNNNYVNGSPQLGTNKENASNSSQGIQISNLQNPKAGGKYMNNNEKINKAEVKKKLDELKSIRSELREKLHLFQKEFNGNHNRKIRYHKDITPVEKEYKRYKEIKVEISNLEALIGE